MKIKRNSYEQKRLKRIQKEQDAAVMNRACKFMGISEPSADVLMQYVQELNELENELSAGLGDLSRYGTGPGSGAGKLENERRQAVALLARMRIDRIKPGL